MVLTRIDNSTPVRKDTQVGLEFQGLLLVLGLVGAISWWAWRIRPALEPLSSVALVLGTIASPVAWLGYVLLTLPLWFAFPEWPRPLRIGAWTFTMPAAVFADAIYLRLPPDIARWFSIGEVQALILLTVTLWLIRQTIGGTIRKLPIVTDPGLHS